MCHGGDQDRMGAVLFLRRASWGFELHQPPPDISNTMPASRYTPARSPSPRHFLPYHRREVDGARQQFRELCGDFADRVFWASEARNEVDRLWPHVSRLGL